MTDKAAPKKPRKPKTQTTPQGAEIPVPKRGEFFRDLKKVTNARRKPNPDAP